MQFDEKLHQLRKQKGYSQEILAEKLGTTRQAISKWENGQGYPETEKIIKLAQLFEVSVDYLLMDSAGETQENEKGFYVSKEMAEGYLMQQQKLARRVSLGSSLLIAAAIPYLLFQENSSLYSFMIILFAAAGIVVLATAIFSEDTQYKVLKKETLLFDQNFLHQLAKRYQDYQVKFKRIIIFGVCLIAIGGLPFLLERKDIITGTLVPYFPICVGLIAVGCYIVTRTNIVLEAYKIMVHNEERMNSLGHKLRRKAKKKLDNL